MNRISLLLLLCLLLPGMCSARAEQAFSFYQRAMAAISTPELRVSTGLSADQKTPVQLPSFIAAYPGATDTGPRLRRPWYGGGREADPKKVGIGLTIAGTILTALGVAIIIANEHAPDVVSYGGDRHSGSHIEYDILGVLITGGGLGMLIPGIVKQCH